MSEIIIDQNIIRLQVADIIFNIECIDYGYNRSTHKSSDGYMYFWMERGSEQITSELHIDDIVKLRDILNEALQYYKKVDKNGLADSYGLE